MSKTNWLLWLVIAINLVAGLYGVYYYTYEFPQVFSRPIYLWPFIPDSAVGVLLAAVVLSGIVKSDLLEYITSVYLVKYGLWTVFVMLLYNEMYLAPAIALTSIFLFIIPHLGMALEAIITLPRKVKPEYLAIGLCWFLFNDSLDYVLGIHTRVPLGQIQLVALFAFCLSIVLCFGFSQYGERLVEWKPVAGVRRYFREAEA